LTKIKIHAGQKRNPCRHLKINSPSIIDRSMLLSASVQMQISRNCVIGFIYKIDSKYLLHHGRKKIRIQTFEYSYLESAQCYKLKKPYQKRKLCKWLLVYIRFIISVKKSFFHKVLVKIMPFDDGHFVFPIYSYVCC